MKKNFALRVDAEVFDAIEQWAADEFRSANGQIEWILSEALKKAKRHPKARSAAKKVLLWLVCSLGLTAQAQRWTGVSGQAGLEFSLHPSGDAVAVYTRSTGQSVSIYADSEGFCAGGHAGCCRLYTWKGCGASCLSVEGEVDGEGAALSGFALEGDVAVV